MFRKNDEHRQQSFFSGVELLPERLREQLLNSWADTFYREVFCRIDETIFAVLYSDEASRPNVPVNVLVGMEILKVGFGWSDEELYEQVCFSLQVRHALGLHDLRAELFTLRTLYNFRKRMRLHAETEGINLMQRVFEQVTDAQLEAVALEPGWQRMDSTQVLSNLAAMTRLELLIAVVQTAYRQLGDDQQVQWAERLSPYVNERPHNICYKIPADETEEHLTAIGDLLVALEAELAQSAPESNALFLVQRVLNEQYTYTSDGAVVLRPAEDISATSLQSPHDPDATYRIKGGEAYPGGYVVNVSETADPENPIQLITDTVLDPNQTDDGELLEKSLESQDERGIEVEQVTVDGGYTGPTAEAACEAQDVDLRATRMRGGTGAPDTWGWDEYAYAWELDDDGTPIMVTCPQGQTVDLQPGKVDGRFMARFASGICEQCPFFKTKCRVQPRTRVGPTLYLQQRTVEVALQRQQLCPDDASIRAVIEATVRSLKLPFANGKLPVRGLIRSRMVIYASALMVTAKAVRRLHTYFTEQARNTVKNTPLAVLLSFSQLIRVQFIRLHRYLSALSVAIGIESTATPVQS